MNFRGVKPPDITTSELRRCKTNNCFWGLFNISLISLIDL